MVAYCPETLLVLYTCMPLVSHAAARIERTLSQAFAAICVHSRLVTVSLFKGSFRKFHMEMLSLLVCQAITIINDSPTIYAVALGRAQDFCYG